MKGSKFVVLLLAAAALKASDFRSKQCNVLLMQSFDLPVLENSIEGENLLCPMVKQNCCSYEAQLMIYKKWQVAKERKHIADFYKEFSTAYEKIFEDFVKIEAQAQRTRDLTADIPNSNCNKLANTIVDFAVSGMKRDVLEVTQRSFKFLLTSRRGFYCSLCDADSHPFFNKDSEEVIVDASFCSKFVEESLNFYLFKYVHFMKISRLYSEFLVKCDLHGNYHPTRFLKHSIKFFRRDEFLMDVNNCKKGFNQENAIELCTGFCKHFNPVKYDRYLEGELEKLYSYSKSLEVLMDENEERMKQDEMNHALDKGRKLKDSGRKLGEGRQLSDAHAAGGAKPAGKGKDGVIKELDEEVDLVTEFNKENNASLITTITYNFDEDLSTRHKISFDDSVFGTGLEKFYNLVDYRTTINEEDGVNFYALGQTAGIKREAAVDVFRKMNPDNKKADADFEAMMNS